METLKEVLGACYKVHAKEIEDLVIQIHDHPELSGEEELAARVQADFLESRGFEVKRNYKGLNTAFAATAGEGRPHICFMSEYDALPGMGHGCGHNLIAGVALGAGVLLKQLLSDQGVKGRVTVMGTPAEEKRGCKIDLIEAGALKDVDIVLMAHPSNRATSQSVEESGIMQFAVRFSGKSAHAAAAPEDGLNALDAVRLLFCGVDAWRQQLPETCRVHGVITDGGVAPNIIPDSAAADFYLRAFDMDFLLSMKTRFENIAQGAALMTGTTALVETVKHTYKPGKPNRELNQAFMKLAGEYGMAPEWLERSRASSDFGDVTYEVPAIHGFFNITGQAKGITIHSKEFAGCAASPFALGQMEKTAKILSEIGYRYLTSEDFRKKVKDAFPFGSI
nr:M20 family metallopeptidase [Desulfobacula sp.]